MSENWLNFDRFAVWGLGRSGRAAANLLARRGKAVVASDTRSDKALAADASELDEAVQWMGGGNVIADAEVVVTSPGLRPGLEIFEQVRQRGLPVISEVDLAFDASSSPWVGITGTDGKTTTTSLTGAMLAAAGIEHVVAGNIGTALCDVVEDLASDAVVVAELSANQLWSCHHLDVQTAAITNIAEDHLDYFDDFSHYPEAKYRLAHLQSAGGDVVIPLGDETIDEALAERPQSNKIYFGCGTGERLHLGEDQTAVYFDADGVGRWQNEGADGIWMESFEEAMLMGPHNQLNAACAAAIARGQGASWEAIRHGVVEFSPLSHRMEAVGEVEGVRFIDDSKATNAHASLAGLRGIDGHLVVIAGGRDKGLDLDQWSREVAGRAGRIIVIGEISAKMTDLLEREGGIVEAAATLDDAVVMAKKSARPGSTVVLSPACSSYDMFSNYRERGRHFQKAVTALAEKLNSG